MFGKHAKEDTLPTNPDSEIFLIYDSKSNSYRQPILAPDKWDMIRSYENMLRNNADDTIIHNAEDYAIFKVGHYFKKTGKITLHEKEHIANLHEVKYSYLQREKNKGALSPT